MSILPKTTPALPPRTSDALKISIFYAALLVIMSVAQLFSFEDFLLHFEAIGLPVALAPIIVIAEVFALPFLLRMSLSIGFRYFSMFLGWVAAGLWFFISVWMVVTHSQALTVGFLGTVVNLIPGWWSVFMSLSLVILAIWSSWGLWPGKVTSK
ncbi:MAG: hypothetical protein WAQ27_00040 [Candidatus Microsaccharimonas sp.]